MTAVFRDLTKTEAADFAVIADVRESHPYTLVRRIFQKYAWVP